ncbi:hypothetical protein BCR34DRAFT_484582 [Clohesyomyces aquaticus]|uniref:Carbohydrate phosphatase n=1 Tax=Clohesyomyces aquaticus TaxID=1231657 RepID=A0A1Y1ZLG7_9PLEO|nr:hypothetical protein BCR34DRAFT_484582 [Clohesyomyces aquaticus]
MPNRTSDSIQPSAADSTPGTSPHAADLRLALRAVHRASLLTKAVLRSLNNSVGAESKADDSPVTIADFAAQALIIAAIHAVYPNDSFVGEESAEALRSNEKLRESVWGLVQQAGAASPHILSWCDEKGEYVDAAMSQMDSESPLATPKSVDEMLDIIDLGTGASTRAGRVWVLDPIDGTATFMQGQQYAVCLCLLEDGVQKVGVIGCPNLKIDVEKYASDREDAKAEGIMPPRLEIHEDLVDKTGFGVVISAVKGQGTYIRSMLSPSPSAFPSASSAYFGTAHRIIHSPPPVQPQTQTPLHFVETTLGKTSLSQPEHSSTASLLSAVWPGTILWSSQMKYAALALGAADVTLRMPKTKERYTFIWDHAGGQIIFQETGGIVRDFWDGEIDLGQGRRIMGERNYGMVASVPWAWERVLEATREVLERRTEGRL